MSENLEVAESDARSCADATQPQQAAVTGL